MPIDTYTGVKSYILGRAYENTDGTSTFDALADDALVEGWRDLVTRWPWLDLVKDPPGVFVTTDDITTTTITVAAAGVSVAGTLSAAPAVSISGRKIKPSGKTWVARVTAHTAGLTAVTLDAAPEALAAGTACVIFQDEYDLASDLGCFVDGLWFDGRFTPLLSEESLKVGWPDPPGGQDYPSAFARLTKGRIRLSHYSISVKRGEYPYTSELADPSGSGTLALPGYLRPAFAALALVELYEMALDRRYAAALQKAERSVERAIVYERRRRTGLGSQSSQPGVGASGRGAYGN